VSHDVSHVGDHRIESPAGEHGEEHGHGHHGHAVEGTAGYHPHEAPWPMLVPLVILSIGAIFAGMGFHHYFIDPEHGGEFWKGSLVFNEHLMHTMHGVPLWVKLSASVVMITGFLVALWAYVLNTSIPAKFTSTFRGLYAFLLNKWYFDELYDILFVRPAFALGRFFWKRGDQQTIDRFGPNGAASLVQLGSVASRKLQSGYVYTYALVMLLGLAAAATWAIAI
jgi:NADH-quinone oxidoreductase subunit L